MEWKIEYDIHAKKVGRVVKFRIWSPRHGRYLTPEVTDRTLRVKMREILKKESEHAYTMFAETDIAAAWLNGSSRKSDKRTRESPWKK